MVNDYIKLRVEWDAFHTGVFTGLEDCDGRSESFEILFTLAHG